MKENSIEEDIKIALDKFSDNKDIDSAILIVEKFILGNYILRGGRKNIVKDSLRYILSDYKKVLKENEQLRTEVNSLLKENEEYSKQLDLDYVDKNYISKQKIKDEIEELKGKLEDISKRREKSKTNEEKTVLWCLEIRNDERIKTLQELL